MRQESEQLKSFKFEVITVNHKGEEIKREQSVVEYLTFDLGNGINLDLVAIPGGQFMMGAPEGEKYSKKRQRPQHSVTIQPFLMGKFPVTQAIWRAVSNLPRIDRDLNSEPSQFKGDNLPVERISWYDAVEFCQRLSKQTGSEYRLPSEAEWEYASRARTTTPYHFGETITSELANYDGTSTYADEPLGKYRRKTTPVGSFPPNAFGLYDLHGLVWEWCRDDWHENYQDAPDDGSAWLSRGRETKVIRGGCWNTYPHNCRCASRSYDTRDVRSEIIGFRVVSVIPRTT